MNLKATLSTDKDTFYRKATIRNYRFVSMYRLGGLAGSPEIEIFGGVGLGRYDHGAYKWARIQSDCSVYTLRLRFWMERKSRTGKFHSTEEVVGAGDNPVFSVIVPTLSRFAWPGSMSNRALSADLPVRKIRGYRSRQSFPRRNRCRCQHYCRPRTNSRCKGAGTGARTQRRSDKGAGSIPSLHQFGLRAGAAMAC